MGSELEGRGVYFNSTKDDLGKTLRRVGLDLQVVDEGRGSVIVGTSRDVVDLDLRRREGKGRPDLGHRRGVWGLHGGHDARKGAEWEGWICG